MSETIFVELSKIKANPYNARKEYKPEKVAEITASIAEHGMLETPSARQVGGNWELVFGHTRLLAYQQLAAKDAKKWATMEIKPIGPLTDKQMFVLGVTENIKRQELNAIEQAEALQRYMAEFGATSKEAGALFGLEASTVRGKVRLLKLQPEIREMLATGELPESSGRQLIAIERLDPKRSVQAANEIVAGAIPAEAVNEAIGETSAIHMHYAYDDDTPAAGDGLWPLGLPMDKFPTDRMPALTPDQMKLGDAEVFAVLNNPPACTACPFYTRVHGDHYCGVPDCHARKTAAWMDWSLKETGKKLRIKIFDAKVDKDPLSLRYYEAADKALFANRNPDLRLKLGRSMYGGFNMPNGMTVVVVGQQAEKLREAKRKGKAKSGTPAAAKEDIAEQERQHALREARVNAIEQFALKEALPYFKKALAGLVVIPVLDWIASSFYGTGYPEKDPGARAPVAKRAAYFQGVIAYELIYEDGVGEESYEDDDAALEQTAKWLMKEAARWGVKLPKGFLEKAKNIDGAAAVSVETKAKKAKKPTSVKKSTSKKKGKKK